MVIPLDITVSKFEVFYPFKEYNLSFHVYRYMDKVILNFYHFLVRTMVTCFEGPSQYDKPFKWPKPSVTVIIS